MTGQHQPVLYKVEKETGDRLPSGYPRLKKLTGRHLQILKLHLAGIPNYQIAAQLDCTDATVSRVLNDPLGMAFIEQAYKELDAQFRGLYGKVIQTIDKALDCGDLDVALSAADKWLKAHGKYRPEEEKQEKRSAEDVIAQMLKVAQERGMVTVQVKAGTPSPPDGFHKIIDVEPEE